MSRFKYLSNQKLVDRINSRYRNNLNDDDEVAELCRRRDEQGFKIIPEYESYRIEE
tara:strand:+ start:1797 stop:1964 length:168 start_codon:yes stop_codon:yes gene_type:complete